MTIPLGQCGHFSQVGPSEKSCFFVVIGLFNKMFKLFKLENVFLVFKMWTQ
jgi:hypothetical protein